MSSRALRKLQGNDLANLELPEIPSDEEPDVQPEAGRAKKNKKKKKPAVENLFELVIVTLITTVSFVYMEFILVRLCRKLLAYRNIQALKKNFKATCPVVRSALKSTHTASRPTLSIYLLCTANPHWEYHRQGNCMSEL